MRIAAAAYPLDPPASWEDHAAKMRRWIGAAAGQGADLLVFPEYGRMELAALEGPERAGDLALCAQAVHGWTERANALTADLAAEFGVHVLAPSGPVLDGPGRPVNRAYLFGPDGMLGWQDKQIMTRYERDTWGIRPGGPLKLFETAIGRIGVLICYDVEFPLLGRALVEAGAEVILAPSATETLAGCTRVRVGARARALEGQCVTVHAPTVGAAPWCPVVDENRGRAGVFGPPDIGFPDDGVIAEGGMDRPGWTLADVAPGAVCRVRREGRVLNHAHWPEQTARPAVERVSAATDDTGLKDSARRRI